MIILRQRTFSDKPEQKEFNSKAQKARRTIWETKNQPIPPEDEIKSRMKYYPRPSSTREEAIKAIQKQNARLYQRISSKEDPLQRDPRDRHTDRVKEKGRRNIEKITKRYYDSQKKKKEMLKLKGALAIGGTIAAGIGAKKLYDKKKEKEEKNSPNK